jgi:NhaA family Na+:H+ antiporter
MLSAVGGVIVPAAVFAVLLRGDDAARAWGVPTATDLALVLGVLALLGPRAPAGLKLFVLTLAITDDLIGIGLIAVFYSHGLSFGYLTAALVMIAVIVTAQRLIASIPVYVGMGFLLWYCTLRSGIEAPLAGAVLGALTPATPVRGRDVLETLERRIVPLSAFVAVPLFALGNVDIDLSAGAISDALGGSVTWAVIVARVGGKLVGISLAAMVVLRLGWGRPPAGVGRPQLVAAAALSGIGFAVAFFVAEAALSDQPGALEQAKLGVLVAAVAAAAVGIAILTFSSPAERKAFKADP